MFLQLCRWKETLQQNSFDKKLNFYWQKQ